MSLKRRIALDRDVPVVRRYVGTFIETSLPTLLACHPYRQDGRDRGARLRRAAGLFPFHRPFRHCGSTSGCRFSRGLSRRVELFAMAMLYHPDLPRNVDYHLCAASSFSSAVLLAGGVALRLRRQFEASIAAASTRDRVTTCSVSTCRRRWSSACCWRARRPPASCAGSS